MKSLILAMALAYVHAANATPPAKEHFQDRVHPDTTAAKPNMPDNIGTATMLKDRTIVLALIFWFPGGGHTTPTDMRYKPGHPEYEEILRHLGGMTPGESKGVKPWPMTSNTPPPDFNAPLDLKNLKDFQWPETSQAPNK
ncbi:hypothetical protein ACHAC9_10105 [Massilia sp. CMS3.1]|uniref:hypothetical protein n=1 Tax=Massilia sp. CMS3.1 TaxID=3373083 RepID=UPI003EE52FFC